MLKRKVGDKCVNEGYIKGDSIKILKRSIGKIMKNNFTANVTFDVVFSTGGLWTWFYLKPQSQKLTHIFHGTVSYFYKNHLKRFSKIKQIFFSPILWLGKLTEQPHYESDKIICVSNKVKKQVKD